MADKPLVPAQPERGWGQMLPAWFGDGLRIENHARNGRSAASFRAEGRWGAILERISKRLFMWVEPGEFASIPGGRQDDTHLNAYGASRICDLAVEELKAAIPALAAKLRPPPDTKVPATDSINANR